ncbi:hypothetical protein Pmani_000674 [Petrolisthes manimaculis]|uniref:Uncharacterized protein n=1 Tax=Petrolisthes manimaculis TaxID=1843537 RepID=A0AAE1USR3_9EUCA|nr:hypothetical protein Pmani_000674 [Petrolisthes manimaculis]
MFTLRTAVVVVAPDSWFNSRSGNSSSSLSSLRRIHGNNEPDCMGKRRQTTDGTRQKPRLLTHFCIGYRTISLIPLSDSI